MRRRIYEGKSGLRQVDGAKKLRPPRPLRPPKLNLVSGLTMKNKNEVNTLTLYVHLASTLRPLARSENWLKSFMKTTVKFLRPLRPHVSKLIAVFS